MQQKKCNQIYIYTVKQNSMASAQASSDCQVYKNRKQLHEQSTQLIYFTPNKHCFHNCFSTFAKQ